MLLPDIDTKAALSVAERLRLAVRAEVAATDLTHDAVTYALPPELRLTASFGVATYPSDVADAAMYRAQRAGRDRVSAAGESAIPTPADSSAVKSADVAA